MTTVAPVAEGRHWAKRPLPEPPRTRRLAKSLGGPADGLGLLLEEWLAEQTFRYTFDGE
ncbi:MAG TPA: hypothetical protein VNA89_14450 [Gemmatimonadaceae bacterium]|nr:hypothetical protein [Gemmatimonadaceae bacterium]